MKVSELIDLLASVPSDMEVLVPSATGTLVRARGAGTIRAIPTYKNMNLRPGHEWRVPVNDSDEPHTEREMHFVVH